ncbi:MAG: ATP-binding protein [Deltaproteobacteria bacterium]|nr:ATP-binding protein [Deltaproteobacteria bacterium]
MTEDQTQFEEILSSPGELISYRLSKWMHTSNPGKYVLEVPGSFEELHAFLARFGTETTKDPRLHEQISTSWNTALNVREYFIELGRYFLRRDGEALTVLQINLPSDSGGTHNRLFVAAESREIAEQFYSDYRIWEQTYGENVMVFDGGRWERDAELYRGVQASSLSQLVLEENLKTQLVEDFERFFASRELYRSLATPWKRGSLLVGPPGNGKTLAIKALASHLKVPLLYVKSFETRRGETHGMRTVFDRARETPGILLVFEDLDALINDKNRSFFLNELDGFANNDGLCIIATTNHPEELDTSILERPSRFDRKYNFGLPATHERRRYLAQWFSTRPLDAQASEACIAQTARDTDGFSFAYLKELAISATMQFVNEREGSGFDSVLLSQLKQLRGQMSSRRVLGLMPSP